MTALASVKWRSWMLSKARVKRRDWERVLWQLCTCSHLLRQLRRHDTEGLSDSLWKLKVLIAPFYQRSSPSPVVYLHFKNLSNSHLTAEKNHTIAHWMSNFSLSKYLVYVNTHLVFTYSKSAMETPEQCIKSIQS